MIMYDWVVSYPIPSFLSILSEFESEFEHIGYVLLILYYIISYILCVLFLHVHVRLLVFTSALDDCVRFLDGGGGSGVVV